MPTVARICWGMCGSGRIPGSRPILIFNPIPIQAIPRLILTSNTEFCGEAVGPQECGDYAIVFAIGIIPGSGKFLWVFVVQIRVSDIAFC